MAEEKRTDIYELQVSYEDAVAGIARYRDEIARSKEDQKLFDAELKAGSITRKQYNESMEQSNAVIAVNKQSIRLLQKEIQNNIKIENEQNGSVKQLQAGLSNLTSAYYKLSEAEQKGAKGKEFVKKIEDVRSRLDEAENAAGNFQRNVGNYQDTFLKAAAGGNQFAASILESTKAGGGLIPVLKGVGTQILAIGKAVIANPIGAIIAAVVIVFTALKKAVDSSAEATNTLSRIMAPFQRILDGVLYVLQIVVTTLLNGVEAVMGFYRAIMKLGEGIPIVGKLVKKFNDEVEKSIQLEKDRQATEKEGIKLTEDAAKAARDVAELRAKAEDKSRYTAEERLKFIKEANKIEEDIAERKVKQAKDLRDQAEEEASRADNTIEKEKELAQLRANVFNEEKNLSEKRRVLLRKESALTSEIAADRKKAGEEAVKTAKERSEAELNAHRAYEDSLLRLMKDEGAKQIAANEQNYTRQIEDLKKRLKEEKNLTQKARKDINATIANLEKERDNTTADLWEKFSSDALKKQADIELTNLNNRLAAIRTEGEESLKLRLDILDRQRDAEIRQAETTGADIAAIRAKYAKLAADEEKKVSDAAANQATAERQAKLQNDIAELELANKKTFDVRIAAKQEEINNLQQKEGESDAMFLERTRTLNLELAALNAQRAEDSRAQTESNVLATADMFGAFSDLLGQFAEQNEALAVFSKATALFEILLSTGVAVARGIRESQSVPFPGNIAAIATTVATIVSGIASATQIVKKAKEPTATGTSSVSSSGGGVSYFSEGGFVSGAGSGTSDSIPAMLSNGESVMTARATSMFAPMLSALNQIGGGVPISTSNQAGQVYGEAAMTRIFANAISGMPSPVVHVTEINSVQNRVKVLESDATV